MSEHEEGKSFSLGLQKLSWNLSQDICASLESAILASLVTVALVGSVIIRLPSIARLFWRQSELLGSIIGAIIGAMVGVFVSESISLIDRRKKAQPNPRTQGQPQRKRQKPQVISPTPPRFAEFLLYLFLQKQDRDPLVGDLHEEFTTILLPKFGPGYAWVWYWKQVLCSLRPLAVRSFIKLASFSWLWERIRHWLSQAN